MGREDGGEGLGVVVVGGEDGSDERSLAGVVSSMRVGSSSEEEGDEVGSRERAGPVESGVAVGVDDEVGIEGV